MKTSKPKPEAKPKKPRPQIVGYIIAAKTGYMKRGVAGQILAPSPVPVQFATRRATLRLVRRYEHQIDHLRSSLVSDWPKVGEIAAGLAASLPLTIQPVHAQ